jgi:hypothetical protein
MDDIFTFFCGTVPILILMHFHRPDPGPWPWLTFVAGGLGGVGAFVVFGAKYAADGGLTSTFLVSFVGGAFLGQVANLAFGSKGIGPSGA